MRGFVTTRDLIAHPGIIIREFGTRCFLRCVWRTLTSGRPTTFLECIECPRHPDGGA